MDRLGIQNKQELGRLKAKKLWKYSKTISTLKSDEQEELEIFCSNDFSEIYMADMNSEVWNKTMDEIEWSCCEEREIVLVSYFVKIIYL